MSNFTEQQIQEYNRKIAVEIDDFETRGEGDNARFYRSGKRNMQRVPSYHSDHAAIHRVVEKIMDNDTDKLIDLCIGTFECVKTTQYDDMGQEIKSYDTEDFSSKGRIMKALYSSVAQYLDQIGGKDNVKQFRVHSCDHDKLASIPWSLIGPHEIAAQANHGQSLNKLHDRGGLSLKEMWAILNGVSFYDITETNDDIVVSLNALIKKS